MLQFLRSLFEQNAAPQQQQLKGYRAYTTKYDLEVQATELPALFGRKGKMGEAAFQAYVTEYDRSMTGWRAAADVAAMDAVERIKASLSRERLKGTVASLLIDHSGSLRGQRCMISATLAEIVADSWSRLGISYEILGFTTQSWLGGQSRKAWRRARRPSRPGRLCDLLHIIYRSADSTAPGAPWTIRNVMRRELLKENVDGEALLWASARLRTRPEPNKILVVVSDGAPVDDSTLSANDPDLLERHLKDVISSLTVVGDISSRSNRNRFRCVGLLFPLRRRFVTRRNREKDWTMLTNDVCRRLARHRNR